MPGWAANHAFTNSHADRSHCHSAGRALDSAYFDGAWVLSDKWWGYMGIALVIKGNEFKYWFYSDFIGPRERGIPSPGSSPSMEARFACARMATHVISMTRSGTWLFLDAFDESPVMNRPEKRD